MIKRIAIDMDEVITDAVTAVLEEYNREFAESLSADQLSGFEIEEFIPPERRHRVYEYHLVDGFFRSLPVMQNSQRVVAALNERYELFVTTAAMEFPHSFKEKYEWLHEHFPFIETNRIVFCGDKSIINADYLIDDRARHFERFIGQGILFTSPHNSAETRYPRVNSWLDVERLFLEEIG